MRRARESWIQVIRQFERSGKTQEVYAKERGISLTTLQSWIYRLRREERKSAPLLPVRLISSPALPARRPNEDGAAIEVELGDTVRLRFPTGTAPRVIAELVAALRSQC